MRISSSKHLKFKGGNIVHDTKPLKLNKALGRTVGAKEFKDVNEAFKDLKRRLG